MDNSYEEYVGNVLNSFEDNEILRFWNDIDLLAQLRQKNKGRQKQVIHDIPRPPLAEVLPQDLAHRILKDIYFKAAALMGYNVSYIPSWNPFDGAVESDIAQSEHQQGRSLDPVKLRRQCKTRITKRMETEKGALQRLGIFADWRSVRPSLESRYEARLLEGFGHLMERGYLTKEAKPSYWCVNCHTILTEDELRLKPRKSSSAYVRFPVRRGLERLGTDVSLLVCVVELWTLPAGIAIALPRRGQYVATEYEGHTVIIEEETAQSVLGFSEHRVLETLDADELLKCTCSHPLLNVELPVVLSENCNGKKKGAGLYLAVPGHNQDDYAVRLEHNFKIVSIIDDEGRLTEDAERFCGLNVFEASEHIALHLDNMGFLMMMDTSETPYPYCWTCDMPAIFRPADQWLFDPQKHHLSDHVLRELETVDSLENPEHRRVVEQIQKRHKVGVSRQRVWGLPVPAFYCQKCGTQLEVDRGVKAVRDLISHKGTDAWFRMKAGMILASDITCTHCGAREFRKDTSILDSRMVTVLALLLHMDGRRESASIGDIYLEHGEDVPQWIALMLLTLYAMKDHFPTRFLHIRDTEPMMAGRDYLSRIFPLRLMEIPNGGADLLRLLMVEEFETPHDEDDMFLARIRENAERVRQASFHAAFVSDGHKRIPRLPAHLPLMDSLFAAHFGSTARQVISAYRNYDFVEAWRRLLPLADDLTDYSLFVERHPHSKERETQSKGLLREWGAQFLKLATPFLPMFGEHLWRSAYRSAETESIFLSEWPFGLDEATNVAAKPIRRAGHVTGTFADWLRVARELRRRAESSDAAEIALALDVPERADLFRELAVELQTFVGCSVPVVGESDPPAAVRLSEIFSNERDTVGAEAV